VATTILNWRQSWINRLTLQLVNLKLNKIKVVKLTTFFFNFNFILRSTLQLVGIVVAVQVIKPQLLVALVSFKLPLATMQLPIFSPGPVFIGFPDVFCTGSPEVKIQSPILHSSIQRASHNISSLLLLPLLFF